jgi:hypothetical protein
LIFKKERDVENNLNLSLKLNLATFCAVTAWHAQQAGLANGK